MDRLKFLPCGAALPCSADVEMLSDLDVLLCRKLTFRRYRWLAKSLSFDAKLCLTIDLLPESASLLREWRGPNRFRASALLVRLAVRHMLCRLTVSLDTLSRIPQL